MAVADESVKVSERTWIQRVGTADVGVAEEAVEGVEEVRIPLPAKR